MRSAQRIRSKAVDVLQSIVNGGAAQFQGVEARPIMDACPLRGSEWVRVVHGGILLSWCGMNFIGSTKCWKPQKIVIGFA
jgi:hypothetical protein